jgi:hypothetical protein
MIDRCIHSLFLSFNAALSSCSEDFSADVGQLLWPLLTGGNQDAIEGKTMT